MLDAAPAVLLWANRRLDANRLDDLLSFMSKAILNKEQQGYIWDMETYKIQCTGWNKRAIELDAQHREAVSH